MRRNSATSFSSATASSLPATSANVIRESARPYSRCRLRVNAIAEPRPPERRNITQIRTNPSPSRIRGTPTSWSAVGAASAS
jgi:hypothetical protein